MPECDTGVLRAGKDFFLPCKFFSNLSSFFNHSLLIISWGSFRALGLVLSWVFEVIVFSLGALGPRD